MKENYINKVYHIYDSPPYSFYFNGTDWEKQLRVENGPIKKMKPNKDDYAYIEKNLKEFMAIYREKSKALSHRPERSKTPILPGSCHNKI